MTIKGKQVIEVNFPVTTTIINNKTISLFDTDITISHMSKTCFDKLEP